MEPAPQPPSTVPPTTVVELPGGRKIAADDVGDPAGRVVVYLHGAPDCRLARHPDDAIAARLGIRLVAIDRPGYGGSDPLPLPAGVPVDPRTWSDDVAHLLDHLGIERCTVAAWSAGCPWAFGLAAGLPDRVDGVVTYGCLAPFEAFDEPAVVVASGSRSSVVEELAAGTSLRELIEGFAAMLLPPSPVELDVARDVVLDSYSPRARRDVESVPGLVDQLARSLAGAAGPHGADGLALDLALQYDTGLLDVIAQVRCPVVLVHGRHDPVAGPAVGWWMAERLASASVQEWDEGHQGLLVDWGRWLSLALATDAATGAR